MRIERTLQRRDVVSEADDRARNLPERMHTSVSAPRAVNGDARTLEARERLFEQTLHRVALGLPLPADEPSAVVRKCEFERAHVADTVRSTTARSRPPKRIEVVGVGVLVIRTRRRSS